MVQGKKITFRVSNQIHEELMALKREKFVNLSELARNLVVEYLKKGGN